MIGFEGNRDYPWKQGDFEQNDDEHGEQNPEIQWSLRILFNI
jgi:hypothetical protein